MDPAVRPPEVSCAVTHAALDVAGEYAAAVRPWAGAVALFVGTTRDTFASRPVLRLEYEGYAPMAEAEMTRLAHAAAAEAVEAGGVDDSLAVVRIVHRLGCVSVGEASIVIAVSSAHRAPALRACASLIDGVKRSVPVWKKEVYGGGEGETACWKENKEAIQLERGDGGGSGESGVR